VKQKECLRRRRELMDLMESSSIAIVPTAPVRQRNRDVEYPYRPDSDFYYLTGFAEAEAMAVLIPGRAQGEYVLFCREKDPEVEKWDGPRAGLEGACEAYGADDAFPIGDMNEILPGLMEGCERGLLRYGVIIRISIIDCLSGLKICACVPVPEASRWQNLSRSISLFMKCGCTKVVTKSKRMQKAVAISAKGHERAMRCCRPGLREDQIEAELLYEFTRGGSRSVAYPSIVAGGANACVMHYVNNNATLRDGDLLLIDAGAEYDCYAADITRTFPVGGRFSPAQRDLYEIVLTAQAAAIEAVRPGNHWDDPHQAALEVMVDGLFNLGLLKGRTQTLLKKQSYRKYYMHRTGHWLGMDVHDVGDYKIGGMWRILEPGMTLTVEPGLYIPADPSVPKKYRNIGIRIEDDVLVTRQGHEVLSQAVPKTVDEIEALVGRA